MRLLHRRLIYSNRRRAFGSDSAPTIPHRGRRNYLPEKTRLPGAVVDYYLPSGASEVKLEFLDAQGQVLRTYSSTDHGLSPDPATDPAAYNKVCQETPSAPDCALPLYWPAPPEIVKTSAGMHRFTWDMHYDALPGTTAGRGGGGGGANGAVPHRTYPAVNAPWVAPGNYTVRLTVDGHSETQPIMIKLDPRVKVTPEVRQIFTLTTQAENEAKNAEKAHAEAVALISTVQARPQSPGNDALVKELQEMTPAEAPARAGGGFGGFGPGAETTPAPPPNLTSISGQLIAAVMPMQASEMPPTAVELENCRKQQAAYTALMAKWSALKARANGPAAAKRTPAALQ